MLAVQHDRIRIHAILYIVKKCHDWFVILLLDYG